MAKAYLADITDEKEITITQQESEKDGFGISRQMLAYEMFYGISKTKGVNKKGYKIPCKNEETKTN